MGSNINTFLVNFNHAKVTTKLWQSVTIVDRVHGWYFNFTDINSRIDYAHFGPSFNTWHRYFNLWFEWEMQHMLKSNGHANYHNFRLPYWDWRIEIQNSTGIRVEDLLTEKRFGATRNVSGFPHVVGDIVGPDGWHTLCSQIKLTFNFAIQTSTLAHCSAMLNNTTCELEYSV